MVADVQRNEAALALHMESDVSKANVAFYKGASPSKVKDVAHGFTAGGLARPLEEQDIRIYSEYRQSSDS